MTMNAPNQSLIKVNRMKMVESGEWIRSDKALYFECSRKLKYYMKCSLDCNE